MNVLNVHARRYRATVEAAGTLIDSLASPNDRLWPTEHWPAMRFRDGLKVGSSGGHGPIRYAIDAYEPGNRIVFRFTGPKGFDGTHRLEVSSLIDGEVELRHTIEMRIYGPAMLSWPFVIRPLHDALIEGALDRGGVALEGKPLPPIRWSLWVRLMRAVLRLVRPRK